MIRRSLLYVAALLGPLASPSCTQPLPQLYVLTPVATPSAATSAASPGVRTLAILPVLVPDYLDRREIVSRTADHRLQVSDSERWGEGLPSGLTRVLIVDLGKLLGKDGFVVTSGGDQPKVDADILLTFDAFERDPNGNAVLAARWMIRDERRSAGASRHFQAVYSEPIQATASASNNAAAEVAALNRNLDRLAFAVAETVRSVSQTSPR
jgi:uncharacterized lipoprotein YmbA